MASVAAPSSPGTLRSELAIVIAVVAILVVLFSPIPAPLLDFLLITNFSFALLILLLTFYMDRPLTFSTFPSVLLIATLFRLSLNVAATRLVLTDAYAGRVIEAVGSYMVAGNYVIGLVVFLILIVVQYVVVTNGAQRVAEVAARFTLDAMPGKQMSIDADLNMGLVTEAEAKERRRDIEREASFYGAMDGASKFVKGDAIAGIIIILINIIGGLSIGMVQRDMAWGEALQTFTLLTIGDGIVTQIPALVIATGTGIIVTRAATDAHLTQEIVSQITRYPKSLVMVAVALLVALVLPGIPAVPVLLLLAIVAGLAYLAYKRKTTALMEEATRQSPAAKVDEDDLYANLAIEPLEIEIGAGLKTLATEEDGLFLRRLKAFRKQFAQDMGLVVPAVRIREDTRRAPEGYAIRFHGATIAEGVIRSSHVLAINPGKVSGPLEGEATKDPAFGLPALWVDKALEGKARSAGYTVVEPLTVLVTHFSEVVRAQGFHLLTRKETERLIARVRESQPTLVEELVPALLSISDIQKVLQSLLKERVPVRNLDFVLEALAEGARQSKDLEILTERVREKLGLAICQKLVGRDGVMHVLTLDPGVDRILREALHDKDRAGALEQGVLDRMLRSLLRHTEEMLATNITPVLMCPPGVRRLVRRLVEHVLPHLNVISSTEIPGSTTVKSHAVVGT